MTDTGPQADPLVERVRGGDSTALDALYRREWPVVYRLCLGFLADDHEAQDAAQDAMLRIVDRIDRFDPTRPFGAWRDAVVLNVCRDRLRRRKIRHRHEESAARDAIPPVLPDPSDEAQAAEVRRVIVESLSRLTEREREVFVLRDLEGLTGPEVARRLGITEGTVRSLLCLARRRLRRLLGDRLGVGVGGPRRPGGDEETEP